MNLRYLNQVLELNKFLMCDIRIWFQDEYNQTEMNITVPIPIADAVPIPVAVEPRDIIIGSIILVCIFLLCCIRKLVCCCS